MKKKFFTCILFLFQMLPVFSENEAAGNASPDMLRIMTQGKLVVAMYFEDVPPFFMHDKKGRFFGLDVDLANDLASKLGVKIEWKREAKTFDQVVDLVLARKADVGITMLSKTLERAKKVRFSESYVTLYEAAVFNRLTVAQHRMSNDPIKLLNKQGTRIGVIDGTSYVGFAKEDFPLAEVIPFENWEIMVKAVLEGKILALLYDEIEIKNWTRDNPQSALYLQTLIRRDKKDPLAIALHWEDGQLHAWLNQYLEKIQTDGTLDKLTKTYLEEEEWRKQLN
jgi:polar amino acid transport system substrate-binding protein